MEMFYFNKSYCTGRLFHLIWKDLHYKNISSEQTEVLETSLRE